MTPMTPRETWAALLAPQLLAPPPPPPPPPPQLRRVKMGECALGPALAALFKVVVLVVVVGSGWSLVATFHTDIVARTTWQPTTTEELDTV